jgi:PII-like signaling protein
VSALVWVGVAVLGGIGALGRFALDAAVSSRFGRDFPLGTLAVNVSGAFLLGILFGASLAGDGYLLAGTAVLGSYTHLLDLDAGDPAAGRGRRGPGAPRQPRPQRCDRACRRGARALDRGTAVNGPLLKLTAHFGERDRAGGELLADAILADFERHGVRTSVLIRGVEGFGQRHHLRTDRLLTLSEDLPAIAVALDEPQRIREVLEELPGPRANGLVTLEQVQPSGGGGDLELTVYLRRRQQIGGVPAFVAVCDLLRRHGVGGATALLGVDGTVEGERRRGRFLSTNADLPTLVVAVGNAAAISSALEELEQTLEAATTIEPVRVCKRDGNSTARPDPQGWQRLTVYTSESATVGGHAVHHELIRRLRRAGARGATSVRGIWGFHGDHAPHGDRLLQLRRRAPIVTTVVDEGERIGAWFEIADQLSPRRGLVTCEPVEVVAPQPVAS